MKYWCTGRDVAEHDERLSKVLYRVEKAGLHLKKDRCYIRKPRLVFFGHVINSNLVSPNPDKVKAIPDLALPNSAMELKQILGIVNYLGKLLPNLSKSIQPMSDLARSDAAWIWHPAQEQTF